MKLSLARLAPALLVLAVLAAVPAAAGAAFEIDPAGPAAGPADPVSPPDGTINFIIDDGTSENSIGDSGQFVWINRFTPNPADFPFLLEEVRVVFGQTLVPIGGAIEIVIHEDTDGDGNPGTGANFLASFNGTVQANDGATFSVYTLTPPVQIDGPGDLLVGIINRYGSEGFDDFPATLDQTASQGRSWAGTYLAGNVPPMPTYPANEQWGTIDSFGFPGNWIVRAFGSPIEDADLTLTKTGVQAGGQIVYTVGVSNAGPAPATNVVVTDPLPAEVTYNSDDCGGMNLPPWTWMVGNLPVNASATCNITVDINPDVVGDIVNTATASSDQTDPVPADNSDTATITIVGPGGPTVLEIPTLGRFGLLLLVLVLAGFGALMISKKS